MGCELGPKHPLVAGTQTAGTIPGMLGTFRVRQLGLSLPGSFPPSSATCFLLDSGSDRERERNPCLVSALYGRERGRNIQFRVQFCSRKNPNCLIDGGEMGTPPGKSHQIGFSSPHLNPLNSPAQVSQFKCDTGESAPAGRGGAGGAGRARLTPSCLSWRQTGLSFMHHVAGSGLTFWIWMVFVAFCPRSSKPN